MSYQPLPPQPVEGQAQGAPVAAAQVYGTAQPVMAGGTAPAPPTAYAQPAYGGYQSGPLPSAGVPNGQPAGYPGAPGQPTYAPGAVFTGQPQQVAGAPVVVVAPVHMTMTPSLQLPHAPCRVVCQHCGGNVVTRTDKITGVGNWLGCAGCCLVGCWLGCFLIPFGIDGLKDTQHSCPQCGKSIALSQQVRF